MATVLDAAEQYSREDRAAHIVKMCALARELFYERIPSEIPWSDPTFQRAIIKNIVPHVAQCKRDSDTLAAIKATFNGASVSVFVGAKQ